MPFALEDLDSNYPDCQKPNNRSTTAFQPSFKTYLGQHVRGGGCHLDRCEIREAHAPRMKDAGFSGARVSKDIRPLWERTFDADGRQQVGGVRGRVEGWWLCDVVVLRIAIRVQFLCATDDANSPARSGALLCPGERPPRRVETTFQPRPSRVELIQLISPCLLPLHLHSLMCCRRVRYHVLIHAHLTTIGESLL
jgi:hypothetical protein